MTVGPVIALLAGLLIFATHRAAVTNPYGFLGQLLDGYYSHWHEPVTRRRQMMHAMGWVGFGIALVGAGGIAFQLVAG